MTLAEALRMTADESVALVGGGGKTTAMFRLAREVVARGGLAITTTTTRIFGAQIARPRPRPPPTPRGNGSAAAWPPVHVLVVCPTEAGSGKAAASPSSLPLSATVPGACL